MFPYYLPMKTLLLGSFCGYWKLILPCMLSEACGHNWPASFIVNAVIVLIFTAYLVHLYIGLEIIKIYIFAHQQC